MRKLLETITYPSLVERYYSNGVLERTITEETFTLKEKIPGGGTKDEPKR